MRSRISGAAAMSYSRATERAASRKAGCLVTSATLSPSTKTCRPSLRERRYSSPVRNDGTVEDGCEVCGVVMADTSVRGPRKCDELATVAHSIDVIGALEEHRTGYQ